jgi:5-methylcytosine-specific restriction endonuclease McrA
MLRNADKARAAMRRWRERHPDEHRAEGRAYYARHRERLSAAIAAYHRANPGVVKAKSQAYRARKLASEGSFSLEQWLDLVAAYDGRCAYCAATGPLEAEHRTPLSRGGTNFIGNILPACRRCNARKHQLTDAEFRMRIQTEELRARPPE